jgi:hypothetical protein
MAGRRRVIMLAIRHGNERPPVGLEEAAVSVALRQSSLKWITWLYMFGFFIEVALVLTAKTDPARILNVALAAVFFFAARTQHRSVRRAADALDRWAPREPEPQQPPEPSEPSEPSGPPKPRNSGQPRNPGPPRHPGKTRKPRKR